MVYKFNKKNIFSILILIFSLGLLFELKAFDWSKELIWDWTKIDTKKVRFSKDFLWGVSTAEYQVSGIVDPLHVNNWSMFERQNGCQKAGKACNHWDRCLEDIQLIKQLGVKAYRFSVEWSKIEPVMGQFDKDALSHYKDFCRQLRENGIEPMVTLHHFTNPLWFQVRKHFEKEENIKYFTRFSLRVFEELKDYVTFWCTINEPAIYAFSGYILGDFPPGHVMDFKSAGNVIKNFMIAHCEVYREIKKRGQELGIETKVGLAHNILQFDPYHQNQLESAACKTMTDCFSNSVVNFFKTGEFEFNIFAYLKYANLRFTTEIKYTDKDAPKCLDFFGLNYYCNILIIDLKTCYVGFREDAIKTDMPYPICAEGFYRALKQVGELNIPIYVTENGISDAKDDRRDIWIKRYIYSLDKAISEGVDVRGFFYWSLMDNFEWNMGYSQKFGLYEVDFKTFERKLRPGAQYFIDVVKNSTDLVV